MFRVNADCARAGNSLNKDKAVQSKLPPYQQLIHEIREVVRMSVPLGARVLVISKGDGQLLRLEGRQGWHFPQTEEGRYAGHHPANSAEAIAHLEALRVKGADFLLLPSTAFWWLDHYAKFRLHLEEHYVSVVYQADVCLIFDLKPPVVKPLQRPDEVRHQLFVTQVREIVHNLLPPDATVLVVTRDDSELLQLEGRQGWHFPQAEDGRYGESQPRDAGGVIAQLEALHSKGADFLVLPHTVFSWLHEHPEFMQYLEQQYRLVTRQHHVCYIYALNEAASPYHRLFNRAKTLLASQELKDP
jgi:hypothetical protein